MKDETEEEHPSYGMAALHRTMNGLRATRLFGSALDDHQGTIRLTVKRAVRKRGDGRDWFFGRATLIDIELSAAQFVEFITNPNVGDGVPCTIRYARDEDTAGKLARMDDVPAAPTEHEKIRTSFASRIADMVGTMKARRAEVEKITAGLSAKARERLRIELDVITQQLSSNVPFILTQLEEASGRVVTAAKHEVEAFVSTVIRTAGLEAIAEGRMPKALTGGDPAIPSSAEPPYRPNGHQRATAMAVSRRGSAPGLHRCWLIQTGPFAGVEFGMANEDKVVDGTLCEVSFYPDDQFAYLVGTTAPGKRP